MAKLLKTSVKKASTNILLIGISLVLLITLLVQFIPSLSFIGDFTPVIITAIGALFLLAEVSFMRKGKGLDFVIGAIGAISLVALVLGALGISVLGSLTPIISTALLIAVVVEIYRK